ncbi:MAG: dienelactone hydrolase [Actinobacteria bacterium 69-20]|nr:dienelactone hydrolase family protein [Actinomycetota bacterium]OJV26654.1 MAG: dienelactone hydrolase [Actinobacteria bacterium 69-20]
MTSIALFHSVLGVRRGVLDAAERLRVAGHDVRVVDQYDGRVFDDYREASAFAESIGYPALMRRAAEGVQDLPDGFVVAGFSNGGGMAEYVATQRAVSGVLMLSGALALAMIGAERWPAGVPGQIHYTVDDPFRNQPGIDAVLANAREAGADVETFDYPGRGHLFTDASLPDEFDAEATELLWQRVLAFRPLTG